MKYFSIIENGQLTVYDNTGKLVWDGKGPATDPECKQVSVHFASNGVPSVQMRFPVQMVDNMQQLKSLIIKK